MRVEFRRLAPGELNLEAWFGGVGVAAAGVAALWLKSGIPTPKCLFHLVTGIPCLTCGSTRATRALLSGDLLTALSLNPLVTVALFAIAAFVLYALIVSVFNLPRLRVSGCSQIEANVIRVAVAVFLVGNWVYLIRAGAI